MSAFGSGRIKDLANDIYDECQRYENYEKYTAVEKVRALIMVLESITDYDNFHSPIQPNSEA